MQYEPSDAAWANFEAFMVKHHADFDRMFGLYIESNDRCAEVMVPRQFERLRTVYAELAATGSEGPAQPTPRQTPADVLIQIDISVLEFCLGRKAGKDEDQMPLMSAVAFHLAETFMRTDHLVVDDVLAAGLFIYVLPNGTYDAEVRMVEKPQDGRVSWRLH